jgi:hypothetical protein
MIRPELILRLPNSPGALAGICRLLSDEHVNSVALALETNGRLHLVVDTPVRATGALTSRHHQVVQQDVLVVSTGNQPDAVAPLLALVSDAAVNVNYAYSAGSDGTASAAIVIGVSDALRASAAVGT